jgi:hypothetical protein
MSTPIAEQVQQLEAKVADLLDREAFIVPITTFDPEPFDLLKEIKAVVQRSGDDYMASFFDANVNVSGVNEVDAIENLKDMLLSRFDYLDQLPPEKLGPGPARQIAVLRTFIRRRG